ncbi:hypothetical protein BpHYR1_015600 [Brachionus plicatilis]|uniref:Uncharacterized protein n=1 Tax=Brachionus plicatilis TaxID=10195 RepID=A0A3M7PSG5_BRAPC|nr:hypothetical protein BpHYR1_015600 [Brachionus plicatilis]
MFSIKFVLRFDKNEFCFDKSKPKKLTSKQSSWVSSAESELVKRSLFSRPLKLLPGTAKNHMTVILTDGLPFQQPFINFIN